MTLSDSLKVNHPVYGWNPFEKLLPPLPSFPLVIVSQQDQRVLIKKKERKIAQAVGARKQISSGRHGIKPWSPE